MAFTGRIARREIAPSVDTPLIARDDGGTNDEPEAAGDRQWAIGTSVGVVLPRDVMARLDPGEGGTLNVVKAPDGPRLRRADPAFERQMEEARRVIRQRRAVLRELAK
jgi:putative addiction module antidote